MAYLKAKFLGTIFGLAIGEALGYVSSSLVMSMKRGIVKDAFEAFSCAPYD